MSGSGDYPMRRPSPDADPSPMPVLDIRSTRDPAVVPAARSVARFRRGAAPSPAPERTARIADLRARVAAGTYDPDPEAIAAAIVGRLRPGADGGRPDRAGA